MKKDTIAAIATPLGAGGIGIVRVSGPDAAAVLSRLFQPAGGRRIGQMEDRHLYLGEVRDAQGVLLDRALAVLMYGPHSYTGEDVAELQLHGGPTLLRSVLAAALTVGARLAEPGEFTLRAFLNGKIALSQAEAVADLISARTGRASRQAAQQLAGKLAQRIAEIEEQLTGVLAQITVGVDFPDDVDAPQNSELLQQIQEVSAQIDQLLATAEQGRVVRDGVRVTIVGAVNVGKSSLLNRLLDAERAIVTDLPGTTRDLIEETVDIEGIPLLLTDTAGFRDVQAVDKVERLGMDLSRRAMEQAGVSILVLDGTLGIVDAESRLLLRETQDKPRLLVINKLDAASSQDIAHIRSALLELDADLRIVEVSARSGHGLPQLRQAILELAGAVPEGASTALVSNLRHIQALQEAQQALLSAQSALDMEIPADLISIDVENALTALGEISGRSVSEEVLNNIFSRFCLGK